MAASQAKLEKMEMRQHYPNCWHTDLLNATAADPAFCCFALCCGPCASYVLRKRALYNDMSRYTCCGGYMPCSGHCGESTCPELCLCTEVFLCFANSVASTRFMIQDEFNIQTTKCDNCIIGFMYCLQQLACIFSLIACIVGSDEIEEASQLLNCFADMVYCSYDIGVFFSLSVAAYFKVCPCMQTQHKTELDKRDGKFGVAAAAMAVPPAQQMSRLDHPLPPPVGYLPPPAYGYPPPQQPQDSQPPPHFHGYPSPPHFHGYPPQTQGYPPPPQSYGYGYFPPPQSYGYPPLPPQPQGFPPASHSEGHPPPPPQVQASPLDSHSPGHPPPPPQVQASPLDSHSHGYPPPPPQTQGSSPASHSEGYTQPPPQAQGSSPPIQSHEYPQPPPGQSHSPAGAAYPPPGHPV